MQLFIVGTEGRGGIKKMTSKCFPYCRIRVFNQHNNTATPPPLPPSPVHPTTKSHVPYKAVT